MRLTKDQDAVVSEAISILHDLLQREGFTATQPDEVAKFCQLNLGHLDHEVFGILFLDNRHRLILFEKMFRGTIDGAAIYPREVAKRALEVNAAAVIFSHNHPSGIVEPSAADQMITKRLVESLALFDIRVLDHVIVSATDTMTFAERGLL